MIFSKNFSTRSVILLLAAFSLISSCTARNKSPAQMVAPAPLVEKRLKIAIFPVVNLSGQAAPLKDIDRSLINNLAQKEITIVDADAVQRVIDSHRIRYLGGINQNTAKAFREESGAEAVLITALDLYSDVPPPKIALASRLVSTAGGLNILWMGSAGLAGDDSPGLLDLKLVEDPRILTDTAVNDICGSLADYLFTRGSRMELKQASLIFRPKISFRSPILTSDRIYTVAVIPFFNLSEKKHAGEIMALHFTQALRQYKNYAVIEPGIIRQTLLDMRIIMGDGISLAHADLIFSRLNSDLILNGKILDYQDYQGPNGRPKVDFEAQLIERRSREVVWDVKSYNQGDDGVLFFDRGKVNTAHAMARQMVQLAVEDIGR